MSPMNKKISSYIRKIPLKGAIVTLAAILIFLFLIFGIIKSRKSVFMPFGFGIATVTSSSMEPELSVNEVVFIKRCGSYSLKDIVVYEKDGTAIVHRIVEISDDSVTTRGDANNINDIPISASSIKGKVVFSIPHIGALIMFIKSDVGILCMFLVAFVVIELLFFLNNRKNDRKIIELQKQINELK